MKRKIYNSFSILVVLAILITAALTSVVLYNNSKDAHEKRLQNLVDLMGSMPEDIEYYKKAKNAFKDMRITLIDQDGNVVYDSDKWFEDMENHDEREEVIAARQMGHGNAVRYSDTMHENYYYYAVRLDTGSVLRISEPQQNFPLYP